MARETKLTGKLTGWFDVRIFKEGAPKENWRMKGDDDNISFTTTMDAASAEAVQFAKFAKPYTDSAGRQRVRATFKIGGRCRWYDGAAQQVQRPANADLDGKLFEAVIQYSELEGDPANPKAARGYWANAVQYRAVEENPFQAMADNEAVVGFISQKPAQPQTEGPENLFDGDAAAAPQYVGGELPY